MLFVIHLRSIIMIHAMNKTNNVCAGVWARVWVGVEGAGVFFDP